MKISQHVPEGHITAKRVENVYQTATHAQLVTGVWKKEWQIMEFRLVPLGSTALKPRGNPSHVRRVHIGKYKNVRENSTVEIYLYFFQSYLCIKEYSE